MTKNYRMQRDSWPSLLSRTRSSKILTTTRIASHFLLIASTAITSNTISATAFSHKINDNSNSDPNSDLFGIFRLQMQVCASESGSDNHNHNDVPTLHGLWPQWDQYCEGERFEESKIRGKVEEEMEKDWKSCTYGYGDHYEPHLTDHDRNLWFWGHEWKRHGTCAVKGFRSELKDEKGYFEKALELYEKYKEKCKDYGSRTCHYCLDAKQDWKEVECQPWKKNYRSNDNHSDSEAIDNNYTVFKFHHLKNFFRGMIHRSVWRDTNHNEGHHHDIHDENRRQSHREGNLYHNWGKRIRGSGEESDGNKGDTDTSADYKVDVTRDSVKSEKRVDSLDSAPIMYV